MKQAVVACAVALSLLGAAGASSAQNVAVVNGKPVPSARADALFKRIVARQGGSVPVDQEKQLRERVREEVINREVLTQEAQRRGLENSEEYKSAMELARQEILIGLMFEDFQKKNKPTDNEIRAEYERAIAHMTAGAKEYKARHILVEQEDLAKQLIAQLNKGGNFEQLAKKHSKDPGSGANGGDLGWADPAGYVPEFAQALKALGKGKTTQVPVKTQFGYHIIRMEDMRDLKRPPPPKLEEVRDQIIQKLMNDRTMAFQKSLLDKAKPNIK